VTATKDFVFEVRVPQHAETVTVDGAVTSKRSLEFPIKSGERRRICVTLAFTPHFETCADGLHYVQYGNLVFSLPIKAEWVRREYEKDGVERRYPYCDYELLPASDWQYGFANTSLRVHKRPVGDVPFSQSEPPVVIKAQLQTIDWGFEDGYDSVCGKVPRSISPLSAVREHDLIPYGCAKLRMTALPFTKR